MTSITQTKELSRIYSLQILRGIAALMVVLYHIRGYLIIVGNNDDTFFNFFTEIFSYGALLFFTISGFLMTHLITHNHKNFLLRRITRIYSTYIIVAILAILAKLLLLDNQSFSLIQLVKNLSLLPFGYISYPLNVEWTLIYEVFFYLVCSFFTFGSLRKYYPYFLIVWLTLIVSCHFLYNITSEFLPMYNTIFTSMYNAYFILGSLTYYIYKKVNFSYTSIYYIILTMSVGLTILFEEISKYNFIYSQSKVFVFMICFSAIVFSVLKLENNKHSVSKTFLIQFGDYSYALYLVHVPIVYIIFSIFYEKMGVQLNAWIGLSTLVILLVVGWYLGKLDIFLQNYIKPISKRAPRALNVTVSILAFLLISTMIYGTINNLRSISSEEVFVSTNLSIGFLDSPSSNSVIKGNEYTGEGWFLDNQGVEKIEIFIDNSFLCEAEYGYPRLGIENVFPGYKDYDKAGFIFKLDTTLYSNGKHEIKVKGTNKVGEVYTFDTVETIINN